MVTGEGEYVRSLLRVNHGLPVTPIRDIGTNIQLFSCRAYLYYYSSPVHKNLSSQICPQNLTDFGPCVRACVRARVWVRGSRARPWVCAGLRACVCVRVRACVCVHRTERHIIYVSHRLPRQCAKYLSSSHSSNVT